MDIANFIIYHKRTLAIVGINVGGILFLGLLYLILNRLITGPIPDPVRAPTQDVAEFVASPKMKTQSGSFKLHYVRQLLEYPPDRMQQLAQSLSDLSDAEAEQLKENVFDVAKAQVVEDAQEYHKLRTPREKRAYIDSKLSQYDGIRSLVAGRSSPYLGSSGSGGRAGGLVGGGGGGRNAAANSRLAKGIPGDAPTAMREFVARSDPGDRAKLETFVGDVQARVQQIKSYQARRR